MAHTQPNITGDIRRIHESYPLGDIADGLSVSLSSEENSLARIDLVNPRVRRRFGRRSLELTMVDRSGFAELRGEPAAQHKIRIRLGHTAIIGRGETGLPLFDAQIISDEHLTLSYTRSDNLDRLDIHDYDSKNGSHIVQSSEQSWSRHFVIESNEPAEPETVRMAADTEVYNWLYDRNAPKNQVLQNS